MGVGVALICFLAASGVAAILTGSAGEDVALRTPSREVVYATRAPLAQTERQSENSQDDNKNTVQRAGSPAPQEERSQ